MRDLKVYRAGRECPANAGVKLSDPQLVTVAFDEKDALNSLRFFDAVVGAVVLEKVDAGEFGVLIHDLAGFTGIKRGVYVIGGLDGELVSFRYRPDAVQPEFYMVVGNG